MGTMRRRRFLQVTAATIAGVGAGACGDSGSGGAIPDEGRILGTPDEVRAAVADGGGSWYLADAQAYVVEVDDDHRTDLAAAVEDTLRPGIESGFLAISQRCPHLACRVPWCETSGWFECPCHGSRFTAYGEQRRGPAERGMSYFAISEEDGILRLLPGSVQGLDRDAEIVDVEPSGPHCV
jgi:cytochrome b6-f complex iron-sulfur subunit